MPRTGGRHHAEHSRRTIQSAMKAVKITVGDGAETIRIEPTHHGIVLMNGSKWSQVLTREEAWQLAEAIDAVATSADEG